MRIFSVFLETICEGEAERHLHALGVEKTCDMRKHLFERFESGGATIGVAREGEKIPSRNSLPSQVQQAFRIGRREKVSSSNVP